MNGPALKIHAGFTGHSALQLLAGQVVAFRCSSRTRRGTQDSLQSGKPDG